MKAYLKGFYGYKNFGDELLLLGVLKWIFSNYTIEELVIEAGDVERLEKWLQENAILLGIELHTIRFVPIQQHKHKRITHLLNLLGFGKYRNHFKFFGGGEVLNTERKFPRNGWNIPLMHRRSIRKRNFVLLGGIGKNDNPIIQKLYRKLLPKAQKIILREKDSYDLVTQFLKKYNIKKPPQVELYHDFSLDVLDVIKKNFLSHEKDNSDISNVDTPKQGSLLEKVRYFYQSIIPSHVGFLGMLRSLPSQGGQEKKQAKEREIKEREIKEDVLEYILINITPHVFNTNTIKKIQTFCKKYPTAQKFFFPCDMKDDVPLFDALKLHIPDLENYDHTQHSLLETLYLFFKAQAGIGARLHFLYPMKIFGRPFVPIVYKDKVRKLILEN